MRPYLLLSVVLASAITCTGGEVLQAADTCTDILGLLDMEPVPQEEDTWCFAASVTAVLTKIGVLDPQSNPPAPYSQCRLYSIGNVQHPGVDCCQQCPTHPCGVPECKEVGWPDDVFDRLTPRILFRPGGALNDFALVKAQICFENESPRQPFIYVAHPSGGIPHTYVVKGFTEHGNGQRGIYVDSHSMLGSNPVGGSFVDFDCYYAGTCPNAVYYHDGDYLDIHPSVIGPHHFDHPTVLSHDVIR